MESLSAADMKFFEAVVCESMDDDELRLLAAKDYESFLVAFAERVNGLVEQRIRRNEQLCNELLNSKRLWSAFETHVQHETYTKIRKSL